MAKHKQMKKYLGEVKALLGEGFTDFEIEVIPKEANRETNALSKYAWQPTTLNMHFGESVTQLVPTNVLE